MPTLDQLKTALVNAHNAGDEDSARTLAAEIKRQSAEAPERPAVPDYRKVFAAEPPSAGQRFNRGTQDIIDRASQLTMNAGEKLGLLAPGLSDIATQQINKEQADYEAARNSNGDAGIDWLRIGGQVATTSPAGLVGRAKNAATLASVAAQGAKQGALLGGLQYDPTNSLEGAARNIGVGAVAGSIIAPVAKVATDVGINAGKAVVGKLRGLIASVQGKTEPASILAQSPELQRLVITLRPEQREQLMQDAIEQIKKTGEFNPAELERKANLLAQGVTPLKSMITRNAGDWTTERNLQKMVGSSDDRLQQVGQELTDVYQRNDAALAGTLRNKSTNLPQGTQEALGNRVMKSVDEFAGESQSQVSKLYNQVRDARGEDLASDARNLFNTLEDLSDSTYAEKMVGSVRNKLRRFGMIDGEGKLTNNTLTVTQAEELRKFVNMLPNDYGKKQIIQAIDADVLSGAGDDAFGTARQAASERFSTLHNPATQRTLNTMGELGQGKTAQNFIQSQIIGGADQDVQALLKTLAGKPDAVASIQAGLLQHLEAKAINPNSGQFSGANFNKALIQIGDNKLQMILGPERAKELWNLSRAALDATYQPPYAAVNHSNTAPTLLKASTALRHVPLVGNIITDEAQSSIKAAGARKQLADALLARGEGQLPDSPIMQRLASALRQSATPAVVPALDERRRPVKKGGK